MDENVGMLEALHRGEDDEAWAFQCGEAAGLAFDTVAYDFEDN
jgi:hypothetical protein